MKRSRINQIIRETEALLAKEGFVLPPFLTWTPEEWATKGEECREIYDNELGWDVTDFGCGDFDKIGLTAVTIRNGNQKMADKYPKPYAEKYLVARENQLTPMHYHAYKMEDIINRGGGILCMRLYNAAKDGSLDETSDVVVVSDGVKLTLPAGSVVELKKGESITYTQRLYHEFWGKEGYGDVLVGEVSMCNDDSADNFFLTAPGRFPAIDEDEAPYRLLCNEYPNK
ncbi:MAG: D-lyxose/D-mannose family sugar isomerase [Clostridia bacterium]|nr:D-lyxose/D-mannose family sugar isomerase [Clostridia bacterium]